MKRLILKFVAAAVAGAVVSACGGSDDHDNTALVAALPKEALASILSYHVLPAKKSAADLTSGGATQDTIYSFDGAVTKLNLTTTNGVVIKDAVLTDAKVDRKSVV